MAMVTIGVIFNYKHKACLELNTSALLPLSPTSSTFIWTYSSFSFFLCILTKYFLTTRAQARTGISFLTLDLFSISSNPKTKSKIR